MGLYFVKRLPSKVFGKRNHAVRTRQWGDLAVVYGIGWGKATARRRELDEKAVAALPSRNQGAWGCCGCGNRRQDMGLRDSRKEASTGSLDC